MRHDPSLSISRPATLADVIARLDADDSLALQARRELVSAVNQVAKFAQLPPSSIAADVAGLRKIFNDVQPRRFGMSARRLTNIRSLFVKALIHSGSDVEPLRLNAGLLPEWACLMRALSSQNDSYALTRFSQWCSVREIVPTAVNDEVVATYNENLKTRTFLKNAEKHVQNVIRSWNRCSTSVNEWPRTELTVIRRRKVFLLPEQAFPASFVEDLNAWCDRLAGTDLLDEQEFRPLRPVTVDWHRKHILRCASALTRQGIDPSEILDLSVLVDVENAKKALRWFLERSEKGKPSQQTHHLSGVLLSIARHWVRLDHEALRQLKAVCSRCRVRSVGMTKKNRDTLRLFDDERLVRDLLFLPDRLMRRSTSKQQMSKFDAYLAAQAVAIAILTNAPIRIENLANIDLDMNIVRHGFGRNAMASLYFPAQAVKNDLEIELPLAPETVRLLDTYISKAWPVLADAGCRDLFPGRNGTKRSKVGFGMAISKTTERELGVRISPHQFRHIAGYLYLKACPADYETVRVLLGHKALQTTIQFYAGMEISAAARRFDEVVLLSRRQGRRSSP